MPHTFPELEGWSFEVLEVSVGVYRVIGRDEGGRLIDAIGFEPDALIAQCRHAASQMNIPAAPPNHQREKKPPKRN
jgi:hypothetical protein